MKYIFTFIFLLSFKSSLLSQQDIAAKPEVLIKRADSLLGKNDRKAINLANVIRTKYGSNDKYLIKSSIILGIGYKNLGKYDSSLFNTGASLEKALKINDTVDIIKLYSA